MEAQINTNNSSKQLTAIERALAAAKARKAAKDAAGNSDSPPSTIVATPKAKVEKPAKEKPVKVQVDRSAEREEKKKIQASAREQKQAQLKEERAARKANREAKKAENAAKREAEEAARRGSSHMKKVEAARSKLPKMEDATKAFFSELASKLDVQQLVALAEHLRFQARLTSTKQAPAKAIPIGTSVRIVNGEARYIGKVGTVTKSQRLRTFVSVPGFNREAYVFTADVEVVNS